jgi:alpha-tubulin suppressor-like RCC1 family protein
VCVCSAQTHPETTRISLNIESSTVTKMSGLFSRLLWGKNSDYAVDNIRNVCNFPISLDESITNETPTGREIQRYLGIAGGTYHTAAITKDGKVVCWGNKGNGQCRVPSTLSRAQAISCGQYYTAALTPDGMVFCWGDNRSNQCFVPRGLVNVIAISCGPCHMAALTQAGAVKCWGQNEHGQCNVPTTLENVTHVSCGGQHCAALTREGTVICWGRNDHRECSPHTHRSVIRAR